MTFVTNAANFVIRAATRSPKVTQVDLGDDVKGYTWKVESIVPSPFCSPWRHPIWWWKLRHLRRDTLLLEAEVDPAFSRRMRELEDEAFLKGNGK